MNASYGNGYEYFNNAGAFTKLQSTNTTTISVAFTNSGSVVAQNGTIYFADGGSLGGSFQASNNANIDFGGGTFDVTDITNSQGPVNVTGGYFSGTLNTVLNWTGGSINSGTSLVVASNGVLNINPGNTTLYVSGALTNYGTVNWQSGNLAVYGAGYGGPFINEPGAVWNMQGDNSLTYYEYAPAGNNYFANLGTVEKTAGTNTSYIDLPFTNSASLLVQSGTLNLGYGAELNGVVQTAPNTGITLGGNFISGTFSGVLNLTGGTLESGGLTVATNGVLNINPGNTTLYVNGALTNYGTVNWQSGNLAVYGAGYGGPFINEPGAVWNMQGDNSLTYYEYAPAGNNYFANLGTVQKSPGTNTTYMQIPFTNSGTLDAQSGTVSLSSSYDLTAGTLNFGLSGPSTYGSISLSGAAQLTGTISANLDGGYVPVTGASFQVLSYGSETGQFAGVVLPVLTAADWQVAYGASSTALQVVSGLGTTAQITGSVTDNLGHGVTNIGVFAYTTNSATNLFFSSFTDGSGNYALNVPNGTFQVGLEGLANRGYGPVTNQVAVISNASQVVNFTLQPYTGPLFTLTTEINPAGVGTAAGAGFYQPGSTASVSATPNTNPQTYVFADWTEGGAVLSTNSTYSFQVLGNHDLVANFSYALPVITNQPQGQVVTEGSTGSFSLGSSGAQPLGYQWWFNGTNLSDGGQISGSQSNVLTIAGAATNNVGNYYAIVTNAFGSATSSVAALILQAVADVDQSLADHLRPAAGRSATRRFRQCPWRLRLQSVLRHGAQRRDRSAHRHLHTHGHHPFHQRHRQCESAGEPGPADGDGQQRVAHVRAEQSHLHRHGERSD